MGNAFRNSITYFHPHSNWWIIYDAVHGDERSLIDRIVMILCDRRYEAQLHAKVLVKAELKGLSAFGWRHQFWMRGTWQSPFVTVIHCSISRVLLCWLSINISRCLLFSRAALIRLSSPANSMSTYLSDLVAQCAQCHVRVFIWFLSLATDPFSFRIHIVRQYVVCRLPYWFDWNCWSWFTYLLGFISRWLLCSSSVLNWPRNPFKDRCPNETRPSRMFRVLFTPVSTLNQTLTCSSLRNYLTTSACFLSSIIIKMFRFLKSFLTFCC